MSVSLILNLLNELNKRILREPLASIIIILFNEFNEFSNEPANLIFYLSHTTEKQLLNVKKIIFHRHAYTLMFSAVCIVITPV